MKIRIEKLRYFTITLAMGILTCAPITQAWQSDNGDSTYTNPPLYGDFPDPDIIRVGDDFYFVTTTFVNAPGLTLLHSQDLVNWEYMSHVIPRLEGSPKYDLEDGGFYRNGVFAPSIRFRDGTFYVAISPNGEGQRARIYYSDEPRGPWEYHELDRGAFDPALHFEPDGTAYLGTSGAWESGVTLHTLSTDCSRIIESRVIFHNRGAEGSKIIKRGDYYYVFQSVPGRLGMTVSRSKSLLDGEWETKNQIDDRTGGHQGALVDLPGGDWYGFVMVDSGAIGRMTKISPVFWEEDWPVWGTRDAPGRVPAAATKPIQGKPVKVLATSDDFNASELGLQWQWNHNPIDKNWSLSERPGYLRLKSTQSDGFWTARNTLTQKTWGPWGRGEVHLDLSGLKAGDHCGFGTLGKYSGNIAVNCAEDGGLFLSMQVHNHTGREGIDTETRVAREGFEGKEIWLRTETDFRTDQGTCSYSSDGETWKELGGPFKLAFDWRTGTFQGEQFAIFAYNFGAEGGFVDVNSYIFTGQQPEASSGVATFDQFRYSGVDHTATSTLESGHYRNPILAGFHPDPSICRAGDDYYLINSTFEYFPGLPIFHSKDLVNWKQIGHVIHRPEQLDYRGRRVSQGLFAPAITYHDGLFYVICTMIEGPGNFLVTAEDPAGPWSDPVLLNFNGIDPSLFFDTDGRAWLINNGGPEGPPQYSGHRAIWVQEFDAAEKRLIGPRKMLVNGGVDITEKPVWIEGPHIYKRGDWYYLCCAEGGTSSDHSQVIFRSEKPDGPYVPWEKNPIMTQRDLDGSVDGAVTCTGHADLVIGPDGNWWSVFLAVRPYKNGMSTMGRETFLLPVNWTEDGWPLILSPGERVPLTARTPNGVEARTDVPEPLNGSFSWTEDFEDENLSLEWIMVREPGETWWKVDTAGGKLALTPQAEKLTGSGNPSYLGRRVRHATYEATLALDVPKSLEVSSGLALHFNERHHFFLAARRTDGGVRIYVERAQAPPRSGRRQRPQPVQGEEIAGANLPTADKLELRIKVDENTAAFLYKTREGDWETLIDGVDASILSYTVPDGLFLGVTVGPHARVE
jgi:alpha-N-arabinofuranosidase